MNQLLVDPSQYETIEREKTKQWCRTLGPTRRDWSCHMALYNHPQIPHGRLQMLNSKDSSIDPWSNHFYGSQVKWKWLKFREHNPFYSHRDSIPVYDGIRVTHWGHCQDGNVRVEIFMCHCEHYYVTIPPQHFLFVAENISGVELHLRYKPLPNWVFPKEW